MPIKNNITGVWRHLKLVNAGTSKTGYTADRSLTADPGATVTNLKDIYIIAESAAPGTDMSVQPKQLLQGTVKTKVVDIQESTDSLTVTGPMLLAETSSPSTTPQIVLANTTNVFGDAANVAVAYLYDALSFNPTSGSSSTIHSYAESIEFTLDSNGFKWTVKLKGDPTSLRPKYFDPATSTIPFGHYTGSAVPELETALRVATYYDFYVQASVKMATAMVGNNVTWQTKTLAGAIESMTSTISIKADVVKLIGRGQAPIFSISGVSMSGSMSVIFPLCEEVAGSGIYPTIVPTWQALPQPWGTAPDDAMGFRSVDNTGNLTPAPTMDFPDTPDRFYVDEISIVPLYVSNGKPVIDSTAFGDVDIDLSSMPVVIKQASEQINAGIIKSSMQYEVIFRD
jgi:hypothetical protein